VELGLSEKKSGQARKRLRDKRRRVEKQVKKHALHIALDEEESDKAEEAEGVEKMILPSLAIQGLGSDTEGEEGDSQYALRSPPPRVRAANIRSRTSPLTAKQGVGPHHE
tara:strand:- start:151 stop:480 length:330 start_codon:yes stop_codon:yes gene_type:complete